MPKNKELFNLALVYFYESEKDIEDEFYKENKELFITKNNLGSIARTIKDDLKDDDYKNIIEELSGNYYHLWDTENNYFGYSTSEFDKYKLKKTEILTTCGTHDLPYKFIIDGKKSCIDCKHDKIEYSGTLFIIGGCNHKTNWRFLNDNYYAQCDNCLNTELKIEDIK